MRLRFRDVFALLMCSASAIAPPACVLERKVTAGETRVGQGKLYQSDNPTYDEFFEGVHAVQTQTVDAVDEEAKARGPLEHALGTRNTTPERLVELTKERVTRGRESAPVHVAVAGLDTEKGGGPPKNVVVSVTVPDEAAVPSSQRPRQGARGVGKSEGAIVESSTLFPAARQLWLATDSWSRRSTTTSRR
jgi:hypothetical protein